MHKASGRLKGVNETVSKRQTAHEEAAIEGLNESGENIGKNVPYNVVLTQKPLVIWKTESVLSKLRIVN